MGCAERGVLVELIVREVRELLASKHALKSFRSKFYVGRRPIMGVVEVKAGRLPVRSNAAGARVKQNRIALRPWHQQLTVLVGTVR